MIAAAQIARRESGVDGIQALACRIGERGRYPRPRPGRWHASCRPGRSVRRRRSGRLAPPRPGTGCPRPARRPMTGPARGSCRGTEAGQRHPGQSPPDPAGRVAARPPTRAPPARAAVSPRPAALLVPQGADAQHPLGGQVVSQVLQQRQRLPVSPVQVLQHEQAARPREKAHAAAAAPPHRGRPASRHRPRGTAAATRGPGGPARAGTDLVRRDPGEPACAASRRQGLGERPERRRHAAGRRASGQDHRNRSRAVAGGLANQPRLADPGFPGQQHACRRAPACAAARAACRLTGLLIPPDQYRTQHLAHIISIDGHGHKAHQEAPTDRRVTWLLRRAVTRSPAMKRLAQPRVKGSLVPPVSSTQMAFVWVYSRTASAPFSRPIPAGPCRRRARRARPPGRH